MCECSVTQSCLTFWDHVDCSPPVSSVHGIYQARILEWLAMPFSRGIFPTQRTSLASPELADGFFTPASWEDGAWPPGKPTWSNTYLLTKCLLLKQIWFTFNGKLLSHHNNEILPFVTTWMDLKGIMPSEISQRKRQILYDLTYAQNLRI